MSTLSDGSATHNGLTLVSPERSLLIANLPLAVTRVALAVAANVNTNFMEGSVVLFAIEASTFADAITVAVDAISAAAVSVSVLSVLGTRTVVLLGVPPAIAVVVSVRTDPLVDAIGRRGILVVEVGVLLIFTVEGDLRSVLNLLALSVVLDDPPVLLDGDIHVSELDLSLLALLDLRELLPLEREDKAVTAPGVDVGDDPDVLDISGDDLLESLERQLLIVGPEARDLFSMRIIMSSWLGQEDNLTVSIVVVDDILL